MSSGGIFDIEGKISHLNDLEKKISDADFWSDNESAEKILKKRKVLQSGVESWEVQHKAIEDSSVLFELAVEEGDESTATEVEQSLKQIEKGIHALELQHMLRHEEDGNDAIVEIHLLSLHHH